MGQLKLCGLSLSLGQFQLSGESLLGARSLLCRFFFQLGDFLTAGLELCLRLDQGPRVIVKGLLGCCGYGGYMLGITKDGQFLFSGVHCGHHDEVSLLIRPIFVVYILEGVKNVGTF